VWVVAVFVIRAIRMMAAVPAETAGARKNRSGVTS
jgi:hypothetical protein